MKKQSATKYAEKEILNGKGHQEIFNHIIATSEFNIHDVAENVRKIPTLEKRKKYKSLNIVLLGIIGFSVLERLILGFIQLNVNKDDRSGIILLFPIVSILLFYGVYKYKRNVHLAAGFLMIFGTALSAVRLINYLDIIAILGSLVTLSGAFIAFYLSVSLVSDYKIDKELQKNNPKQRENLITFID